MFHILHVFWHHFFAPIVLFYICIKPDANSSPFPYPLCKKAFSLFISLLFKLHCTETLIVLYREYLFLIIFLMITKKLYVIVNSVKVILVL